MERRVLAGTIALVANAALRERSFVEIKRLCYAGLDAATLLREVARRLEPAAPFDAYCAQTNDPLSGLLTRLVSDGAIGEREHRFYLDHVYFEEDLEQQRMMVRSGRSVVRLSDATGGVLERALRCREITHDLGLGHELLSICTVGQGQWGGITLIRERGRSDFDERDASLLNRLVPHLGAGLKAAALRVQVEATAVAETEPGVLVLDDRGRVMQFTAAALRWLEEFTTLGPAWTDGIGLPEPIRTASGAVRRALAPGNDRESNAVPRIRAQTRSGRWITFHAARSLSPVDGAETTIVIIEPSRPRELAWLRGAAYGLSDREREVVDRVVHGASTKEIARALFISEYTVQEHLSHTFDKVGVRGRRALVKRLFFDNVYTDWSDPPSGTGSSAT